MKKILLALLIAFAVQQAPWRLGVLFVEVMLATPGQQRLTQEDDKYWDVQNLESRLAAFGWDISYVPNLTANGRPAYGVTRAGDRTMGIEENLHWNDRLVTLAHEGGHTFQPASLTRNQGEAFAESVATLVAHDGYREHARYLSALRADFIIVSIVEWRAIYRAAGMLKD